MKHSKQISLLAASIALLATTPLLGDPASHVKDKAYIKDAIRKIDVATQNRDLNGYMVFLYPDYKEINEKGVTTQHSNAEMRENLSRLFARATTITVGPTTLMRFVFDKQGATVYESGSIRVIIMANEKKYILQSGGTDKDFWVKTAAGWLKKRSFSVSTKSTLNGKPVP